MIYATKIDAITENFISQFGSLNADQLNWKPNVDEWSIAQNIDHIITINESYYPIFKAIHNDSLKLGFMSKIGFMVNWFGDIILKSVNPDRKKKTKTFDIWEPSKSTLPGNILETFEKHQETIKERIKALDTEIKSGIVIPSPANKHIVYKLDKAIEVIITHEERHFNQAIETYKTMIKSTL